MNNINVQILEIGTFFLPLVQFVKDRGNLPTYYQKHLAKSIQRKPEALKSLYCSQDLHKQWKKLKKILSSKSHYETESVWKVQEGIVDIFWSPHIFETIRAATDLLYCKKEFFKGIQWKPYIKINLKSIKQGQCKAWHIPLPKKLTWWPWPLTLKINRVPDSLKD